MHGWLRVISRDLSLMLVSQASAARKLEASITMPPRLLSIHGLLSKRASLASAFNFIEATSHSQFHQRLIVRLSLKYMNLFPNWKKENER